MEEYIVLRQLGSAEGRMSVALGHRSPDVDLSYCVARRVSWRTITYIIIVEPISIPAWAPKLCTDWAKCGATSIDESLCDQLNDVAPVSDLVSTSLLFVLYSHLWDEGFGCGTLCIACS